MHPIEQVKKFDIQAVAIDMDGTLLGADHKISSYSIEILNTLMNRGIACIIATGRSLGVLKTGGDLPQGMHAVCLNGAQLAHLSEAEPLEERYLPEYFASAVTEAFASFSHHLHAYVDDKLWCENANMELLGKYGPQFRKLKIFENVQFSQQRQDRILKFVTVGEPETLEPILNKLRLNLEQQTPGSSSFLYANYSMPGIMEIQDNRVDKGSGLLDILHRLNLQPEQLMAIGDSHNDCSMWDIAGVPVVMSNAFPELKSKNYFLAPSHVDDGAAHFLRTWFHIP